jgi:hypothetical protein
MHTHEIEGIDHGKQKQQASKYDKDLFDEIINQKLGRHFSEITHADPQRNISGYLKDIIF